VIQASRFKIHRDALADGASLRLAGELDIATVPHLGDAVGSALDGGAERIVLDLRSLRFIDSSGLRQLILLNDRSRTEGWALEMIRPPDPTMGIFRLTGAEENLPFVEAEAQGR
jgi:anti-sigma B factor antagonist